MVILVKNRRWSGWIGEKCKVETDKIAGTVIASPLNI